MPSERTVLRGLAVRRYGSSCHCCGQGPLSGRSLFLAPIGFPDVACAGYPLAPVCSRCATALKTTTPGKHLDKVRRDAKLAMVATRKRAIEWGQDLPLFVESGRYD